MQENFSLLGLNTFGLNAHARWFAAFQTKQDLQNLIKKSHPPVMILGSGSNVLFEKDFAGTVLKNEIFGKKIIKTFKNRVHVQIGGGENWHEFVLWAVANNFGGVENLSLIPGTVGASPIQNIGAYGVEIKDVFVRLEAVEIATGKTRVFNKKQCQFGYRDSIFKREGKGKYVITQVVFSLSTQNHKINISYGDIQKNLSSLSIPEPSIADVSQAVIAIRSSKLPDPAKIGNCGSFFKNPEISGADFLVLQGNFPNIPNYPLPDGSVKIPAGWLIEQSGWKGKNRGQAGCYEKQALVLVNLGGATGAEVRVLAEAIIGSVFERFGVLLEAEVNFI